MTTIDLAGYSPEHVRALQELFGIRNSDADIRPTLERCLGLPAFLNGIRLISSSVARIPLEQFKRVGKGGREKDKDHPNYHLLNRKSNPFLTSFAWRQALVSSALWSGSGYSLIARGELGQAEALYNLDSRQVYLITEFDHRGRLAGVWYGINVDGHQLVVPADEVIHIRNISINTGLEGVSVVDQLRQATGKALAVQKFQTILFKNGSHVNRWLSIPGWLTEEQQQQIKKEITEKQSGLDNAHKMMVLFGNSTLNSTPVDAEALQLIESAEASDKDIANILGLPSPSWVGGRGYTSYSSLQQDELNLLNHCLEAWYSQIEAELESKLLLPSEREDRLIEFNRKALTRGDGQAEVDLILKQYQGELISFEEARALLNFPTDHKGRWIRPANFQLIGEDGMPIVPEPPEPPPAPEPPVDEAEEEEEPPVEEAEDEPEEEEQVERQDLAEILFRNTIARLRKRIGKAVASGQTDLARHHHVIRSAFEGIDATEIIQSLDKLQEEVKAVLPEQRQEVIEKWNPSLHQ